MNFVVLAISLQKSDNGIKQHTHLINMVNLKYIFIT